MKKETAINFIILFIILAGIAIYSNPGRTRISKIGRFKANDITKITFQYENPAIKSESIENKERIKEFINYLDNCVLVKRENQELVIGHYLMIVLYKKGKVVLRITPYSDYIRINYNDYDMEENKLSLEKIEEFVKTMK